MSYIALYREFRPTKFSDIVGQQHISEILKNQIINDRIGHAYLFSGIRGTGKTTSAKVFARAINCLNPQNGEPCNECEICKAILDGSLTDVTEIDAASNNGVDNIRDIREEVTYLPTRAKYRVYIIDEVHMLSPGAFNALLKTLEEPPKHVKFILATTEPNKLPATILSRCQRFDFKRITSNDIIERLKYILKSIGKTADDEALRIIATLSDGALRDAISILDRCTSDSDNITVEYVQSLLGLPDDIKIINLINNMVNNDAQQLIVDIESMLKDGDNILAILDELIKKYRDLLIYMKTKQIDTYNEEVKSKLDEISKNISIEKVINNISEMSKLQNSSKWSSNQEIVIEAGLIGLCVVAKNDGLDDIKKRIEKLESGITVKKIVDEKPKEEKKTVKLEIEPKKEVVEEKEEEVEQPKIEEVEVETKTTEQSFEVKEVEEWREILTNLREKGKVKMFTNLVNASAIYINDNVIGIYLETDFTKSMVENPDNIQDIKQAIQDVTGKIYEIRCFLDKDKKDASIFNTIEDKAKELNIPIDVVDE